MVYFIKFVFLGDIEMIHKIFNSLRLSLTHRGIYKENLNWRGANGRSVARKTRNDRLFIAVHKSRLVRLANVIIGYCRGLAARHAPV